MWDVSEATRCDPIFEDFLELAFGPAKEPMRDFYSRLDGDNTMAGLVFDDLLARLFRQLAEAKRLASERPAILARLDDLILYTRYAELYDHYRNTTGPEHQAAFEAVIRHA